MQTRGIGVLGRLGGGSTVGAALAAILLPKCPLCIAAFLGALGIGATGSMLVAPWLRPACIVLAVLGAAAFVVSRRRKVGSRVEASSCCRRPSRSEAADPYSRS